MPLPAALRAKLQARGILDDNGMPIMGVNRPPEPTKPRGTSATDLAAARAAKVMVREPESDIRTSYIGCPNKTNPYHVCSEYCRQRWGAGFVEPEKYIEKKRQLMLLKYPKPAGWKEIYDPGTGRHYYWNVSTDEVSWLPPEHPRAFVTVSANKLRAILLKSGFKPAPEVLRHLLHNKQSADKNVADEPETPLESMEVEPVDPVAQKCEQDYGSVQFQKPKAGGKAPRYKPDKEKDALDPMDPAAYSEVPRGGWSTGLEVGAEAKTGVDATASGPLFQCRPYPSPGAILRRNAGIPEKKK